MCELLLDQEKKIFDAELSKACEALRLAKSLQSTDLIMIFMNFQTIISRLQHAESKAEQEIIFEA